MIKKIQKNVKGITLIALVVTIIVLLILAGVAISLTIGQNGIISRAQEATVIHENASVYEQLQFVVLDYQMSDVENSTETEILSKLKEDGYVNEDNTLNIERLMGRKLNTGRGNLEDGDVYVLDQREEITSTTNRSLKYHLIYYDGENKEINIGIAFEENDGEVYEPTDPSIFSIMTDNPSSKEGILYIKDWNAYYSNPNLLNVEVLVIPEEIYGIKVVGISNIGGSRWNDEKSNTIVEKIIIPETVKVLEKEAFSYFAAVKSIKLPENLRSIEEGAFKGCISLEEITIPPYVMSIGKDAFKGCENLKKITINASEDRFSREKLGVDDSVEIIYDNRIFENFSEEYFNNKTTDDLEELVLKYAGYVGSFEEFLTENGMSRENLIEQAQNLGMTYDELLKSELSGWIDIEFIADKEGLLDKNMDELEQIAAEKFGFEDFNQLLIQQNYTKEQFNEKIKNLGFRDEIDYLKFLILGIIDLESLLS